MYSNELQLELIGGNCMDKIAMVKKELHLQNWSDKELARQSFVLLFNCHYSKNSLLKHYLTSLLLKPPKVSGFSVTMRMTYSISRASSISS